ncbi:MAG: hypothetical protein R3C41_12760 [Calditrichia bacterium]
MKYTTTFSLLLLFAFTALVAQTGMRTIAITHYFDLQFIESQTFDEGEQLRIAIDNPDVLLQNRFSEALELPFLKNAATLSIRKMEIEADDLNQLLALSKNVLSKLELRDVKIKKDKSLAMANFSENIRYLSLVKTNMPDHFWEQFSAQLPKLEFLELEDSNIKVKNTAFMGGLAPELITLRINDTKLSDKFFGFLTAEAFPKLEKLELRNVDLDKKKLPYFVTSSLIPQLKYLDLSNNTFENTIFRWLPMDTPGNLKVLKLNNCGIFVWLKKTDFGRSFNASFPALSKALDEDGVNWQSPLFQNLDHLEINGITSSPIPAIIFMMDSTLQHIRTRILPTLSLAKKEVDMPIMRLNWTEKYQSYVDKNSFSEPGDPEKKSEPDNSIDSRNSFYAHLSSIKFQPKIHNIAFENLAELNLFTQSAFAKSAENLILSGENWNNGVLKLLLSNNPFENAKYISLVNPAMTEAEIYDLIHQFPQYQFDVSRSVYYNIGLEMNYIYKNYDDEYLQTGAPFWPRVFDLRN